MRVWRWLAKQVKRGKSSPTKEPAPVDAEEQAPQKVEEDVTFFWLYILLLCMALVCLFSSELFEPRQGETFIPLFKQARTYEELIKELGYALIIAIVIAITIESVSRRAHNRDMQRQFLQVHRNVFGGIFGIFLPKSIIKEFADIIVNSKFFKYNYLSRYTIAVRSEPINNVATEIAEMRFNLSYRAKNTTPNTEEYSIILSVSDPPKYSGWPEDTLQNVFINGKRIYPASTTPVGTTAAPAAPTASSQSVTAAPLGGLTFEHATTLSPNEEIEVSIISKHYRYPSDSEVIYTPHPSLDMQVQFVIPPEIKNIGASAIHRQDILKDSESDDFREHSWRTRGPVLPYQGIYVWWTRG